MPPSPRSALANGALDVRLQDAQGEGSRCPRLLNEFKKNNLALEFQTDPKAAADIAKLRPCKSRTAP